MCASDRQKSASSCICTLFLPQLVEIELISALRAVATEIRNDSNIFHIWASNVEFEKRARRCICTRTLFLSIGVESEVIFFLRTVVSEIQADFQNLYILGM